MIEIEESMEKGIIVAVQTTESNENFYYSIEELKQLVGNTGVKVVGELTQKREQVDNRTLIGKGKIQELKSLVNELDAKVVIFNQELSPSQVRNIQEEIDVKVIDRIQVILDIFALRATSKEGSLQVQLAQMNYLLPRLVGHGVNMSKLGGGIGTRGPGETKLETDRRHINRQITEIKRELKKVEAHRSRRRKNRQGGNLFQVGLIGYTNAGKSTILNGLTDSETYEKDELFATLDPITRRLELNTGLKMTLTDTVGFIQDLPTDLIEAFQSTLEETRDVDLLLHVVDAASPNMKAQEETVLDLVRNLEMDHIPILTVYNKRDLVEGEFYPSMYPNIVISATNKKDLEALLEKIESVIREQLEPYSIMVPADRGDILSELKTATILKEQKFDSETQSYRVVGLTKSMDWLNYILSQL
ncbi:MAG: GTPase HflX [Atopostipes suicloacalis]|nr:GTPase HflX [Atopostipes suicloacalis]